MVTAGMSACPLVGKVDALGWVLCSWVGSCARRLDSEVAVRARTADLGAGECVKVADTLVNLRNGKLGGPMKATGRYERVACVLGNARKWRGGWDCVAGGGCSVAAWTLGLRTFTLASRLDIRHGGGGMGAAARGGGLHAAASNPCAPRWRSRRGGTRGPARRLSGSGEGQPECSGNCVTHGGAPQMRGRGAQPAGQGSFQFQSGSIYVDIRLDAVS